MVSGPAKGVTMSPTTYTSAMMDAARPMPPNMTMTAPATSEPAAASYRAVLKTSAIAVPRTDVGKSSGR